MNSRPQAIKLLSPDDVMRINRKLGEREQVVYTCLDKGRVESAVFAAFTLLQTAELPRSQEHCVTF